MSAGHDSRVQGSRYYKRVLARRAANRRAIGTISALLGMCVHAFTQSPPPAPAASSPAYTPIWNVTMETPDAMAVASAQRIIAVAHAEGVAAFAKADGQSAWTRKLQGITQLVASAKAGASIGVATASDLVALDPDTGDERWRVALVASETPAFLATFGKDGLLIACGKTVRAYRGDGTIMWSVTLGGAATTPVIEHASVAWLGTTAPSLVRIDTASGSVISETAVPSPPQAIAVADGEAYVVAMSPILAMYRAGEKDPSWQWKPRRGVASVVGAPFIHEQYAIVAALDNTVQVFQRDGGAVRWRRPLPSRPATGPTKVGTHLIVPLTTGGISRFSLSTFEVEPSAVTATPQGNPRLLAFDLDEDGAVFTATVSTIAQVLTAWRPGAPSKPPQPPSRRRPAA